MSMLTPEPGLLFWMTISFGIVAFILVKFGFPIILGIVDKRKEFIDNSLMAAKEAREELERVKENSEAIIDKARREQSKIINAANQMRNKIIEEAEVKAQTEAEKIIENSRLQIEAEKENALRAIRSEVAKLSVSVAEKILREKLEDEEEQSLIVNRFLDEVMQTKS